MMSKVWNIMAYEYRRHVLQKRFILVMLSVPLVMALMIGIPAISIALERDPTPVGYVDLAGVLADPLPAPLPGSAPDEPTVDEHVPLVAFDTEAEARQALEAKEIQAYYVIQADYMTSNQVELVYFEAPGGGIQRQFWDFMQINGLDDLPREIASRAVAGSNLIVRWPEEMPGGGREFSAETFINNFIPIIMGISLVILLLTSSGYLMGAVVEEKENRTMELLMTSVSPGQLMTGKVLGISGVTLTQLVSWIVLVGLAVFVGGRFLGLGILQNLRLDWGMMGSMVLVVLPTWVMVAALMTAVGATLTDAQEAQQLTGVFVIPLVAPMWLGVYLIQHPSEPLAVALSLFPITSVTTLSMRLMFGPVPGWQVAVAAALTAACAAGAFWVAGRAVRLGMLRYGKRVNWREILSREARERGAP
jgi:ABC-2 type transport system permease protein